MLQIVCVKWGALYGADYVNILYDMVRRNIKDGTTGKFVCFTDNPDGLHDDIETRELPNNLTAWWNKLYLFKDGLFPDGDRILYLDLDTIITGSIDDIIAYQGDFAILRDVYRPDNQMSAVMSWVAGECGDIWNEYVDAGFPSVQWGDQGWIEKHRASADIWQDLYPNVFVSYKVHCQEDIPKGAKVVVFHGVPMPHSVIDGWVPHIWKIGGGSSLELEIVGNTHLDVIKDNIRYALNSNIPVINTQFEAHSRHAVIVGGAPSINGFVSDLLEKNTDKKFHFIALNNSWKWLKEQGIRVDSQIMLDARKENINFVPCKNEGIQRLYATQCDPDLVDTLIAPRGDRLWNALIPGIVDNFNDKDMFWVGAGTSVGIRAILLLYVLGFRTFHIYGYDSCYTGDEGHAYSQILNNGEKVIEVQCSGRSFRAAPWMITQTEEFLHLMEFLTNKQCQFTIHGDGLLQHAVRTMLIQQPNEEAA